jgi:hypothetical protein
VLHINTMNQSTENIQHQEFVNLSCCLKHLREIPESLQSPEYKKVVEHMRATLQGICIHDFVEDYIDIDPDRGQYITYCIYCEKTVY